MKINRFDLDQLELLAAGYVLDDLDEAERVQVKQLIESSPIMREQISKFIAMTEILATDVPQVSPPPRLKAKVRQAFNEDKNLGKIISEPKKVLVKSQPKAIVNLENWFEEIFVAGWQIAEELLGAETVKPAFRNSSIAAGKKITIGPTKNVVFLVVTVTEISLSKRHLVLEVLPELEQQYLPRGLQIKILDSDGDPVMEAIVRQDNHNVKFDFSGTSQEAFSVILKLSDNYFEENFIL